MTGFMLYQKLNGKWRDDKMSDKYQNTELIPEERAVSYTHLTLPTILLV